MSFEAMEMILRLLQEGNPTRRVVKDVGCSQSALSKIWCEGKQNKTYKRKTYTARPRKTVRRRDGKLEAIGIENRKCMTKLMKNKWKETGVGVCEL